MTYFAAGAAVVGAVGGIVGSNSAKNAQQQAAQQSLDEQKREYDTTRSDNQTGLDARNSAIAKMQELAGTMQAAPTAADVMATPGYQFGLTQGQKNINSNASATGGLYSGAQLKAAGQFGTDYATTKYDDSLNNLRNTNADTFNRYASISGRGQTSAGAINSAGQNMANQNSATYQGMGNAAGASAISSANAITNGVNGVTSALKNGWNTTSYTAPNSDGSYNNVTNDGTATLINSPERGGGTYDFGPGGYAEGGPVIKKYAMGGPTFGGMMGRLQPFAPQPQGFAPTMHQTMQPAMQPQQPAPMQPRPMMGSQIQPAMQETPQPYGQPMMGAPSMTPGMGAGFGVRRPMGYADGGQVDRKEPVVGTRTPLPQGQTGGGLSSQAIRDLIAQRAADANKPQTPNGLGQLPANYLTHPKAVLQGQEDRLNYVHGGAAVGGAPGTDTIPAMLDNGEHVVTADEVTKLGGGDNHIGQMKMAQLRKHIMAMH